MPSIGQFSSVCGNKYLCSCLFEIFFLGGIFYGWAALVYVMKEELVYYELCNSSLTESEIAIQSKNMTLVRK